MTAAQNAEKLRDGERRRNAEMSDGGLPEVGHL
jgi:hypothetical protein